MTVALLPLISGYMIPANRFMMGGLRLGDIVTDIYIYSSDHGGSWACTDYTVPTRIYNAKSTQVGQFVIVSCHPSDTAYGAHTMMMVLDTVSMLWTITTREQQDRQGHSMIACGDAVYLIGGMRRLGTERRDVELATVSAQGTMSDWVRVGDLPMSSCDAATVVVGDTLFYFGGSTIRPIKYVTESFALNTKTGITRQLTSMAIGQERCNASAVVVGTVVWILGGSVIQNGRRIDLDSVLEYSPVSDEWKVLPWTLPEPVSGHYAFFDSWNQALIIQGSGYLLATMRRCHLSGEWSIVDTPINDSDEY